jgi:histidinol-phosphate aminotransferase
MKKKLDMKSIFKSGVINNKAYTLKPIECPVKLNQNESPFDVQPEMKNRILEKLKEKKWNIYPDFIPVKIYEKVAKYYKVKKENILIGNGSNEMIFTILAATLEKGKKIIIPEPTFTVYKLIASNLNATIKSILLNPDFTFNKKEILKEAKTPGSVLIICSPNNPTGTFMNRKDLEEIISSSNGLVIVDEAYIQFGGESVLGLINKYNNLIILRTFSKVFGLAGLRIGLMISNIDIIRELSKVKLPYNLNILTLTTLELMLDSPELNTKKILEEKKFLENELSNFNELSITPSSTNFFLVKVKNSYWLFNKLLKSGILVRDVSSYPMLKNHLRISVGSHEENVKLINALKKIYKRQKP